MKGRLSILFFFSVLLFCCETTPVDLKVRYDQTRDLYIASTGPKKGAVLRDNEGNIIRHESEKDELVDKYNENDTSLSLLVLEFEKGGLLRLIRQDHKISTLYFSGVKELNRGNYVKAIEYFKKAEDIYPKIMYYSDIAFLTGYCHQKLGKDELAEKYYYQFVHKSAQKYSARFHEIDRFCSEVYREQLDYARHYISKKSYDFHVSFTENETEKYFNNYHYPGFAVGLRPGISSIGFTIIPDLEDIMDSFVYLGMSYTFTTWFDAGVSTGFPSPFYCELSTDFQLIRTKDRRFGISLEPSVFYILRKEMTIDDEETGDIKDIVLNPYLHFVNASLNLGAGFYILPDFFIGGYYQYNLFNEDYKFEFERDGIEYKTWINNSYRITLKYAFLKNADLDVSYYWKGKKDELYCGANFYYFSYNLFIGYGFLENQFVIKLNSVDLLKYPDD